MKACLLKINAPPVVVVYGEQMIPREIIRNNRNWTGSSTYNGGDPTTFDLFKLNDAEYLNGKEFLELINDFTDDRHDYFRGTLSLDLDGASVDGFKWFKATCAKPRRSFSLNSISGPLFITAENPYDAANYPRTPLSIPGTNVTTPYHQTSPELIFQVTNSSGTVESAYPKTIYLADRESYQWELAPYGTWIQTLWVRPDGVTTTFIINTATDVSNVAGKLTITKVAHGFLNGRLITYQSAGGGDIIGGLTIGSTYHVFNKTADTFELAVDSGGPSIAFVSTGTGANHTFTVISVVPTSSSILIIGQW